MQARQIVLDQDVLALQIAMRDARLVPEGLPAALAADVHVEMRHARHG